MNSTPPQKFKHTLNNFNNFLVNPEPLTPRKPLDNLATKQIEQIDTNTQQIDSITPLRLSEIKMDQINQLISLIENPSIEFINLLIENKIIQQMVNMLDSKDQNIQKKSLLIISSIIRTGLIGLEDRQQNPYYRQFVSDGTIDILIQLFTNQYKWNIHYQIAQILAQIYKSLPLPVEIRSKVIQYLKTYENIDNIALLAENQENHDAILENSFEKFILKNESKTLEYLGLIKFLLLNGSNQTKQKICEAIREKVRRLTIDVCTNQLKLRMKWDNNQLEEVKACANEINSMIENIGNLMKERIKEKLEKEEIKVNNIEIEEKENIKENDSVSQTSQEKHQKNNNNQNLNNKQQQLSNEHEFIFNQYAIIQPIEITQQEKLQIEEKEKESDSPKQKIKKKDNDKVKDQVKDKDKDKEKQKLNDKQKDEKKEKVKDNDKVKDYKKDKVKEQQIGIEQEKEKEQVKNHENEQEQEQKKEKEKKKDDNNHHKKNKRCNTLVSDPIFEKLTTHHLKTRSAFFLPINLQESFFQFNSGAQTDRSEDSFRQFTNTGAQTDRSEKSFQLITNSHESAFQPFTVRKTQSYKDIHQPFTCIDQYLVRLYQLKIQFDQFKKAGFKTVASYQQLNELKDMLVQSKKSKRTEDIKTLQIRVCSILNTLLIDNRDCAKVVIETGIIDEVLSIINLILLSQVQIVHLSPLHEFFEICSSQQKLLFINKGIIPTMRRLLDSRDELCVKIAVGIIERIIHASQEQQSQGVQIDIKQIIENDGTLEKLVTVLQNDEYQDQEVNQNASLAIGQIFKASALPKEFRNDVILTIKKMTNNEDQYISSVAIGVLSGLAECQDNHSDILSSNYPASIAKFISQKKDIIVHYTLQLIHNILTHGLQQTVGMAILFFPIRTFEELSEHSDPFIAENARAIISIFKK